MSGMRKKIDDFIRETKERMYFAWKFNKPMFMKAAITFIIVIVALVLFLCERQAAEVPIIEENEDIATTIITSEGTTGTAINGTSIDSFMNLPTDNGEVSEQEIMIYVDVAGAVVTPGVVTLPEGSRVFEAIREAGGIIDNADTTNINLAAVLKDGDKLYVPTFDDMKKDKTSGGIVTDKIKSSSNESAQESGGIVNINTASSAQLQSLSGIGPSTAEKIIEYRNQNGNFLKIDDLKKVSGIGEKTFAKFKDKICI